MKVLKEDLDGAVSQGVISGEQAGELWRVFREREGARFDLANVAYYLGALVVISAMTWFMTLGWERFGGGGILAISLAYAAIFAGVGWVLWNKRGLRVPGGLLVVVAVCMVPLAVYGFERMTGLWLQKASGDYADFYVWIRGGWFLMELGTIVAGLVALRFVRFPFLTAPIAFALWFMSMDLTPLLYGENYYDAQGYQTVSLVFGLIVLAGAYIVDRRTDEDYAFWGYIFGTFAFWGGLTMYEGGTEAEWVLYAAVNLLMVLISVLLDRRVFIVFGAIGLFSYVGHLAWEIFENSLLFPFALSAVGAGIMALGIFYARNKTRIERSLLNLVPDGMKRLLPRERLER